MKSCQPYEDVTMVRLLQKGEDGAFTELYNRYWDKLFYLAGRKLGSLNEVEEIVQDILTELWHLQGKIPVLQAP